MNSQTPVAPVSSEDGIFETNQIHMAVFFMCRGHQPIGAGRRVGETVYFQFRPRDICQKLKVESLVGDDMVSAREYAAHFHTLKQLIYDA